MLPATGTAGQMPASVGRQRVPQAARDVGAGALVLALPGGSDERATSLPAPSPGAHRLGQPRELAGDNPSTGRQELS